MMKHTSFRMEVLMMMFDERQFYMKIFVIA